MFCLILLILLFSRRWYWHGGPYYNSWSHPYGYGYGGGYPYGAYSHYNPYWRGYGAGYGYGYAPYGSW